MSPGAVFQHSHDKPGQRLSGSWRRAFSRREGRRANIGGFRSKTVVPAIAGTHRQPGSVVIVAVADAVQLDAFIAFPARLYGQDPNWTPPLHLERRRLLDASANRFFRHAEVQLWLAYRDGRLVGRISAQIDRRVHVHVEPALGQWGMFDAEDDPEAASALLGTAEDWLKARGMRRSLGPCNLAINDEPGLLVEGFDAPATFLTTYSPPYLASLIERQGHGKARDRLAFALDLTRPFPANIQRFLQFDAGAPFRIRAIDLGRLGEELQVLEQVFADIFSDNWGYLPTSFRFGICRQFLLRLLCRRNWIRLAEVDGTPAAVIMVFPNLNELIHDMGGSLSALNAFKLIVRIARGRTAWVRVPIFGLHPEYRKSRIGISMTYSLFDLARREAHARGAVAADLCWIQEENEKIIRLIAAVGARHHKTFRLYEKDLSSAGEEAAAAC